MSQNRFNDMRIVSDAQLVRDRQEEGVGLRDSFVLFQLLDENVRLGGIASTEDRPGLLVNEADLVPLLVSASEVGAIAIIYERKDAPAD